MCRVWSCKVTDFVRWGIGGVGIVTFVGFLLCACGFSRSMQQLVAAEKSANERIVGTEPAKLYSSLLRLHQYSNRKTVVRNVG